MKHVKKSDADKLRYIMTQLNWISQKDNPDEHDISEMKRLYQVNLSLIKKLELTNQINSN
jgi:hypothetical protein